MRVYRVSFFLHRTEEVNSGAYMEPGRVSLYEAVSKIDSFGDMKLQL